MIVATHNISDCHIDVVNYHRQMVRRRTIRARQNKVFKCLIINVDRPTNDIFKTGSATRYFKTYRPRRFLGLVRGDRDIFGLHGRSAEQRLAIERGELMKQEP